MEAMIMVVFLAVLFGTVAWIVNQEDNDDDNPDKYNFG